MDSSLRPLPLARLLVLNTEIHEIRSELMREPLSCGRVAELQDEIDRRHRASLTTCWLSEGYELEDETDEDFDLTG